MSWRTPWPGSCPQRGSQVPMLVDQTFEAVQRADRYTIMQDQRMHPASFA